MKFANVRTRVAGVISASFIGAALMVASPVAQAQQFGVGVQFGRPAYGFARPAYVVDRDDYYRHEDYREHEAREFREREAREFREREAREDYARRQAYFEHERWEREHRYADFYR